MRFSSQLPVYFAIIVVLLALFLPWFLFEADELQVARISTVIDILGVLVIGIAIYEFSRSLQRPRIDIKFLYQVSERGEMDFYKGPVLDLKNPLPIWEPNGISHIEKVPIVMQNIGAMTMEGLVGAFIENIGQVAAKNMHVIVDFQVDDDQYFLRNDFGYPKLILRTANRQEEWRGEDGKVPNGINFPYSWRGGEDFLLYPENGVGYDQFRFDLVGTGWKLVPPQDFDSPGDLKISFIVTVTGENFPSVTKVVELTSKSLGPEVFPSLIEKNGKHHEGK